MIPLDEWQKTVVRACSRLAARGERVTASSVAAEVPVSSEEALALVEPTLAGLRALRQLPDDGPTLRVVDPRT